jgi:hypothetical protein
MVAYTIVIPQGDEILVAEVERRLRRMKEWRGNGTVYLVAGGMVSCLRVVDGSVYKMWTEPEEATLLTVMVARAARRR